ncbi:hypothetical protein PGB90_008283 [Kerria lacca]
MPKFFDIHNMKIRVAHGAKFVQIRYCHSRILEQEDTNFHFSKSSLNKKLSEDQLKKSSSIELNLPLDLRKTEKPVNDNFRVNCMNIQMLSKSLYEQLFSKIKIERNQELIDLAISELRKHGLPGKLQKVPDVDLKLPKIYNNNLEEHFYELGKNQSEPYRKLVNELVKPIPEIPHMWEFVPGWTKYIKGKQPIIVDYPDEEALVFDVEVCCKEGENPVIATAVSNSSWYCWISEDLYKGTNKMRKKSFYEYSTDEFVPLESSSKETSFDLKKKLLKPKIVVGHHISYDRARIKEQYWINRTNLRFLDTMSLHICISGITSHQKAMLKSGVAKYESWNEFASLNNSLKEVYKFYCNEDLKKETRDIFVTGELKDIKENFQNVVTYCARDVQATHKILTYLWNLFLERFPHPVTLAGMLELSTCYLPVNQNWRRYIQDSQDTFDDLNAETKFLLSQQADKNCQLLHNEKYKDNLWLWDQDWSIKTLKLNKVKTPTKKKITERDLQEKSKKEIILELSESSLDPQCDEFDGGKLFKLENYFSSLLESKYRLPIKITYLAGYPNWYRKICDPPDSEDWKPGSNLVSTSIRSIPKHLSLTWNFMPLHYLRNHGWCFLVPYKTDIDLPEQEMYLFPLIKFLEFCLQIKEKCVNLTDKINTEEFNNYLKCEEKLDLYKTIKIGLLKLPHKDGDNLNVGNPLSRDFINKFSDLYLSSSNPNTYRIIEINRRLTYWKNNKDRIENQIVVRLKNRDLPVSWSSRHIGVILPQVIVCGTLTRRAVESTWMTASNADFEKIGSELRSMIQAPPGYSIVGADVDSQELWIASLIGDAYFAKEHGCTAFSWMTLSGQKADETDMHSVTAKTMGISRNDAKVINYARIYGAGSIFSERLLKQFIPGISDSEANLKARKMFQTTKGKRLYRLKQHILINHKKREFTKIEAKQLCMTLGQDVNELFERPKWTGGSESAMFNSLEEIACSSFPTTPFLQARLSKAVETHLSGDTHLMPTKINWVVQSSAVDFLHLMLVCMRWLIDEKIRFCLSFHDEVRYLVPDTLKYQTALALHITNLLVRSFCVQRLGMCDLPQSVAFFSSVEVDTVFRKDATLDCVTPSNPYGLFKGYGIPYGESLDILTSIKKANGTVGKYKIKDK